MLIQLEKTSKTSTYGPIELFEGIVNIPGAPMNVYSFMIDGVLIDSASPSLRPQFLQFAKSHSIDHILHTHFHEDHIGNTADIIEHFGVEAHIHTMSTTRTKKKMRLPTYRQAVWGPMPPKTFASEALKSTFTSANTIWDIIETPGHTQDHVALYNRQHGYLFTGDLFITPKPKVVLMDENVLDTIDSLQKVLTYDFETMICHHAGIVENGRALIQMKLDYLMNVQHQVRHFMQQGKDVFEITAELFPKVYPITQHSNSEWSALHMVRVFMNEG
jgi:endoribonuclease LACTB2